MDDVKSIVKEWLEVNVNHNEYTLTLEELVDLVSVAKCRFLTKIENVKWLNWEDAISYIQNNENGTIRFEEWKKNLLYMEDGGKFRVFDVPVSGPSLYNALFILEQKHLIGKWRIVD